MEGLIERAEEQADEYRSDTDQDRPLAAYTGLLATYGTFITAFGIVGRSRLPGRLSNADLVLGAVATHKLARVLTKDPVTSPLRAPFARYEGVSGPSELDEDVRGTGWRHAIGELLTCPFCIAQWTATALVVGLTITPRFTRMLMSILTMVTAADALQLAYTRAEQAVEE